MLSKLNMSDDKSDIIQEHHRESDYQQDQKLKTEMEDMIAMGLPTCFGNQTYKKTEEDNCQKFKR